MSRKNNEQIPSESPSQDAFEKPRHLECGFCNWFWITLSVSVLLVFFRHFLSKLSSVEGLFTLCTVWFVALMKVMTFAFCRDPNVKTARKKRATADDRACNLFMQSDTMLWDRMTNPKEMKGLGYVSRWFLLSPPPCQAKNLLRRNHQQTWWEMKSSLFTKHPNKTSVFSVAGCWPGPRRNDVAVFNTRARHQENLRGHSVSELRQIHVLRRHHVHCSPSQGLF